MSSEELVAELARMGWPPKPSPRLDELVDAMKRAPSEPERKLLGVAVAEMIMDHGRDHYRGWRVVCHLRVSVLEGAEADAAAWIAARGIALDGRRGRSRRRCMGRDFMRAGVNPSELPEAVFEWYPDWNVRMDPRKSAATHSLTC